jgi:hypothetical protein
VVKPKRKPSVDDEALERALAAALARQRASDVPRRDGLTQIEDMLRDRPRREVCEFASYSMQVHNLGLRPWQSPPCHGDSYPGHDGHAAGAALLQRLLAAGLSRFEPDPIAALERVETRPSPAA